MKRSIMVLIILSCLAGTRPAWSGQLVTPEVRKWAQEALREERALETVAEKNTLAVLYFKNDTGRPELDPLQKGFAIMLMTDLSKLSSVQILERVKVQALLEEMKLGTTGLVEKDSAPRVGKLLGAYYLVGGGLSGLEQTRFRCLSYLVTTPTGKPLGEPSSDGDLDHIFRMEKEIAFQIIKLLSLPITAEEEEEIKKPFATSLKAAMDFFRGMDLADRGLYDQAAKSYEDALKEDPSLEMARDALEELRRLQLTGKAKRRRFMWQLRSGTSLTDEYSPPESLKRVPSAGSVNQRIPRELPQPPGELPPLPPPPAPDTPPNDVLQK